MRTTLATLVLLAACGDDEGALGADAALPDAGPIFTCPDQAPPLGDCSQAVFSATCGNGEGEPRLACNDDVGCLWFTNGCVAAGYQASDCPADDVCCHDNWPFTTQGPAIAASMLYAFGHSPWDPSRELRLPVVVDTSFTASVTALDCGGGGPLPGGDNPCERDDEQASALVGDTVILTVSAVGLHGWSLWIELVPQLGGEWLGRACASPYSDVTAQACTASEPVCAKSGSLKLNRIPTSADDLAGLAAEVDLDFLSGTILVPPTPF